jgi:hypothetical protein
MNLPGIELFWLAATIVGCWVAYVLWTDPRPLTAYIGLFPDLSQVSSIFKRLLSRIETPKLRTELLSIQSIPAVKINNMGSDKIRIVNFRINDRTDCQPLLIAALLVPVPFDGADLQAGDATLPPLASLPKFDTDHGTETYYWK